MITNQGQSNARMERGGQPKRANQRC